MEAPPKIMSAQLKHYYTHKDRILGYYKSYYETNSEAIKAKRRERYRNAKAVKEQAVLDKAVL